MATYTYIEETRAGEIIKLPERGGWPQSVHVLELESLLAINAALATGRPLLVRGEPGTGKSQLARAAAVILKRAFVAHAVDGQTETRDLLWTVDVVARLAEAQIMATLPAAERSTAQELLHVSNFTRPGPLWWAFDWETALEKAKPARVREPDRPDGWTRAHGVVVLVDEIDKADASVPNGLLDALGHGSFEPPGCGPVTMDRSCPPLVVITTNEERSLPDAFLRRCLVLHLELPTDEIQLKQKLISRGVAHFDDVQPRVLELAAEKLAKERMELKAKDLSAPGLAELIDLVRAVKEQRSSEKDRCVLLEQIYQFTLKKHPRETDLEGSQSAERQQGGEQAR